MIDIEAWDSRPKEVASLLNPAYVAVLLHHYCAGYKTNSGSGAPYATSFIAVPLLLYQNCTTLIPKTSRTTLHSWIYENQELLFEFPERAKRMSPFVREGLFFGAAHGVIKFESGAVQAGSLRKAGLPHLPNVATVASRAQTLGKIFGRANEAKTIFAIFGVRP